MKVLIVSDTHRRNENYLKIVEREQPLDLVIHCGDVEGSEYLIGEAAGCNTHIVLGNNDFFSYLPREKEFTLGKYHVFITHGNNYGVSLETSRLKSEAIYRKADIVMYGHTHRPEIEIQDNLTILNPGSLSYPRQWNREPSYIIMEIDQDGQAHYQIYYLEE